MKDMMEYKSYFGSVHYSDEDSVFHGKVEFIRSLITYEGTDVENMRGVFKEAVDDYLQLCKKEGETPGKSFKGTFNVRSGPVLHREATIFARQHGTNLNNVVVEALKKYLDVKPDKRRPRKRGEGIAVPAGDRKAAKNAKKSLATEGYRNACPCMIQRAQKKMK